MISLPIASWSTPSTYMLPLHSSPGERGRRRFLHQPLRGRDPQPLCDAGCFGTRGSSGESGYSVRGCRSAAEARS